MLCKKDIKLFFFVILCIFTNLAGKIFAASFHLPLWLDSFGTVAASYALGTIPGAIVGITMNILYSIKSPLSAAYSLTSIAIAIIIGFSARKKWLSSFYKTMNISVLLTACSVIVSVSVSWFFADGMTNNIWGDGVIRYLEEQGLSELPSSILGQFYLDFLDKAVTLIAFYFTIKIWKKRNLFLTKKNFIFLMLFPLIFSASQKSIAEQKDSNFNTYVQTIYSNNTGLPCGEANDIAQTPNGILWIGTYAGLYRYNGSEFRCMTDFQSVRSINCLYVDEEGRLWIGTNDNGLSICINGKIVNTLDRNKGLPSNSVRKIVKGADGYYYVGTSVGILVLELNSGLRICNIIKEAGYIMSLSADNNGFVAAVSSGGKLFILNESEIRYSQVLESEKEIYTCCSFDKDGILNVGTSKNHIYRYKVGQEFSEPQGFSSTDNLTYLKTIYFDKDRRFVCADNGIGYYDNENNFVIIGTGRFNNSIDNMCVDYQGNYWFTSSRQGLMRLSASAFTNLYASSNLPSKVVNTVTKWQDSLYIGTDKGLDIIKDGKKIQTELSSQLASVRIRCIKKDSNNHLWICTYGRGLLEVEENGKITVYDSSLGKIGNWMRVVIELSNGTMLAAGEKGISFIKNKKVTKLLKYGENLSNAVILSLMEMPDGTILAGSDGDGLIVIQNEEVKRIFTQTEGLTSGVILRTVCDPINSGVYIITSNSLCYMDKRFSIRAIENFPYFNNYDIQIGADGNLFVLGSAGIYIVSSSSILSAADKVHFDLLDSKSGLTSSLTANAWNYIDEEGTLYLSTGTGVYSIDTSNYSFSKLSYRMMVSSVKLDSVTFPIDRDEPLIIGRNISKIEIFPEVINFTVLDPQVGYWLEGFDQKENIVYQSKLSSIVYTNLPYGSYSFHLSVFDKDQNILEESVYSFIKEKEIYDNTYFKVYLFLVALIAVAWLTFLAVRSQLQHRFDLQKKEIEFAKEQIRMGNETILAIAKTVDAKDENTSQHSMRVSEYSVMIADELGFKKAECENLRKAALLHDIGKIGIPDRILNKPSRLDDDEYEIMKTHVTRGAEILKGFTMIDHVDEGARYHHERWDGSGYADGLKGEEIPLYARIIGIADAFDAMTANRVYRKKLDFDFVVSEIKRCRGTQFDPKIADILLSLIDKGKIDVEELYNESKHKQEGKQS